MTWLSIYCEATQETGGGIGRGGEDERRTALLCKGEE